MSKQALAVKYRPRKFEDVVEQTVPKAILTEQLKNKTFKNCLLFCGGAGTGKAQPLYSKVLTPNGFITMGDVEVGTEVITDKGNIAEVSGVYPQGIRPIYRITLQDRTYIDVSDEHLNVVYRYNQHKKVREDFVLTTKELLTLFQDSSEKLRIDVPKALDFGNGKDLPIDPYLLGALIGDGSLSPGNFAFSNMEEDVLNKVDSILDTYGCELVPSKDSMCDYRIRLKNKQVYYKFKYKDTVFDSIASLSKHLNEEGYPLFDSGTIIRLSGNNAKNTLAHYPELFGAVQLIESVDYNENCHNKLKQCLAEYKLDCKSVEKHIPQEYLLSSKEDRLQLLRGLFDTDGYVDNWGNTILSTSSPQLSDDIAFLVRSLGCRDTVTCSSSGYVSNDGSYISCSNSYSHNIKVPKQLIICSSEKHLNRYRTRMYEPMRNIIDIEYIGNMECQCIMVDHEDHTYISDGFIPTHNTTSARIFANEINDFKGHPIEIDAASHNGVEDARKIIEDARTQSLDSEYKTFVLDECFTGEVEILTDGGYIPFKDLQGTEFVAQYTLDGKIEFVKPEEFVHLEYEGVMYELYSNDFTVKMSPHHVQPLRNKLTGKIVETYIEDYTPNENYELIQVQNGYFKYYNTSNIYRRSTVESLLDIYCVKVPSKMIVVRTVEHFEFISGNCHMLSNSAWNALLKVIEEPPKKTVFLFCTTDPQKIPATILSRVQRYNFQKISQSGIIGRLKYIIEEENKEISAENPDNIITYEDSAIEFIAKLADGGMRDSITLLDKALGYSNKLTLDNVLEALGSVNYDTMFELTEALNKMNATKALETIGDVYKSGLDLKQFIKQYSYFVLDLCKYKYLKNFDNLQMPAIYEDKLKTYGAEDFDFFCQLLDTILELSKALKDETVPKPLVESKLLLLCMEA